MFFLNFNNIKNIINIFLSIIIVFSSIKFLTKSKSLYFWAFPNLGDDYFILTIVVIFLFIIINFQNFKIKFNNTDLLFLFIIFYFLFIELFSYQKNLRYVIDFFSVYFFFKFFKSVKLNNFHKNFLKIFISTIIFSALLYLFFLALRKSGLYFEFISYNVSFYTYTEYFYLIFFSNFLLIFFFKNPKLFWLVYITLLMFLFLVFSRSSLLIFLLVYPILILLLDTSNKIKFYMIVVIGMLTMSILYNKVNITLDSFKISSEDEKILFNENFTGEKNSTIQRLTNFKRHLNKLENNYWFGLGYNNFAIQEEIKTENDIIIEYGACECSNFISLFAYGIVGFILTICLIIKIIYPQLFLSYRNKEYRSFNLKLGILLIIIFYGFFYPDLPAWFGYALYIIENKNI